MARKKQYEEKQQHGTVELTPIWIVAGYKSGRHGCDLLSSLASGV